jgi:hypothetical protein
MKIYSVVLMLVASVVVGCGGNKECDDCQTAEGTEGVAAAACPRDECEPPEDPVESIVVSADLKNTTANERACDMAHSYILANGATAPGELYIFTVPPGGTKTHTIVAPLGSSVVFTARCWLPGYQERVELAVGSVRTGALYGSWAIHATYAVGVPPSMVITTSEH